MNAELKRYLKIEMTIAAAFNFFINGMVAALIYHMVDNVPTDIISIAIDLTATCLFTFILCSLFCRASVRRTKTAGILETKNRFTGFWSRLFRRPVLFGLLAGLASAAVLYLLTAPLFLLLGIYALPFGVYIALKCVFSLLFGGGVTFFALYSGMCKTG